jgi:hypothetical protein
MLRAGRDGEFPVAGSAVWLTFDPAMKLARANESG